MHSPTKLGGPLKVRINDGTVVVQVEDVPLSKVQEVFDRVDAVCDAEVEIPASPHVGDFYAEATRVPASCTHLTATSVYAGNRKYRVSLHGGVRKLDKDTVNDMRNILLG